MKLYEAHQTKNPSYKRNRSISPVGILVHSTGANNPNCKRYVDAEEYLGKNTNGNHWNKDSATKSMHAFVGYDKDKEVCVVNTLPYDRACWGAGKGSKGSANYDPQAHLQFEICQSSSTDSEYYWKAITVAEEYCAYLCKKFGWTVENITSHKEAHADGLASNHGDPQSWMRNFGDDMDKFRSRVAERLGGVEPPTVEVEEKVEEKKEENIVEEGGTVMVELTVLRQGDTGSEVKTLQRLLNALKYNCGSVDGIFGNKTRSAVKAFQNDKKLTVDAIVGKDTWIKLLK